MLIIQKFGGTSLADGERIQAAARRAVEAARQGAAVVTVVSAQGHTTDRLLHQALETDPAAGGRELDALLASGEQVSAALMAMAIRRQGWEAVSLTGWQAGLQTEGAFGDARLTGLANDRIRRELKKERIVVVAGFQGVDRQGNITTLGRGGSDTTAVALAAWLGADVCRIYTDVDGVYDRDPRLCPEAKRFDRIGYEQMLALARGGAQVLHDRCVELGKRYRVPIQVLSSFRSGPGTLVGDTETLLPVFYQDIP